MSDSDLILELRRRYMECQDASDAEGCSQFWDENGSLLPPNEPAVGGRGSLRAWYERVFQHMRLENQLTYEFLEVIDGYSFASGAYTARAVPLDGSEPIENAGKFLEVHKRQNDGSWKFYRHMWSSNGAPN